MPYQAQSLTKIIQDTLTRLRALHPDLEDAPGTTIRDMFIDLPAIQHHRLDVLLSYLSHMSTVRGALSVINSQSFQDSVRGALGVNSTTGREYTLTEFLDYLTADISAVAQDHHMARKAISYGRGAANFYFSTNDAITINLGTTLFYPRANLRFETTQQITNEIPVVIIAGYRYVVPVPCRCITPGPEGNIRSGRKLVLDAGSLANLLSITNEKGLSGGYAAEGNQELLERIPRQWSRYKYPRLTSSRPN